MGLNRSRNSNGASLDLTYQPAAHAGAERYRVERVVLELDGPFFKEYWDPMPYAANKIVLGTAKDDAGETGYTYLIVFSNADFAYSAPTLIIDGSALSAPDFTGEQPFFGDAAVISLAKVTAYNAVVTTGGANDAVSSGIGSDVISTGGGDDFVSIGTGNDTVRTGSGNDYIDSTAGDVTLADFIDGGRGRDELSFYSQDISDAVLSRVVSVEQFGLSAGGDLELGTEAQRVGVDELFVDDTDHAIVVREGFTNALTVNMYGNFRNLVTIDASQSSATLTVHAEYAPADLVRDFHGGSGSQDTLWVSSGFSDLPTYGADLTEVTGFEHIVVDGGFDAGGSVTLDTAAGEIAAAFQTIDAHTLAVGAPLTLKAGNASADLHVTGSIGADAITTGSGADRIEGGLGADTLAGRGGHDMFVYTQVADSAGEEADTIRGFRSGRDTIDVTGLTDEGVHGQTIDFFGNQNGSAASDTAFSATAGDGVLDAVFRTDTHTLWFDTNDDGRLGSGDLSIVLTSTDQLKAADVLSGQMVI